MKTALHCARFLLRLDQPHSQVTEAELSLLLTYARGASTVVELGCYEGRTSVALALETAGSVISVDPFTPGRLGLCYGRLIASTFRRRARALNLRLVRGCSHEVAGTFDRSIDLLFVDADRTYEAACRDWAGWLPKVVLGGYVAAHDCRVAPNSAVHLGSMRYYDECLVSRSDLEQVAAVDSLVIFRKRH